LTECVLSVVNRVLEEHEARLVRDKWKSTRSIACQRNSLDI
jgi:hypothetical protein